MSLARRSALLLGWLPAVGALAAPPPHRINDLNQAFLRHVDALSGQRPVEAAVIRESWTQTYRDIAPEAFVPDALAVLYPDYRQALEAFDSGNWDLAKTSFAGLLAHEDAFLSAESLYFHVRANISLQAYEEALRTLEQHAPSRRALLQRSPHAPQLLFAQAVCLAATLRHAEALQALEQLRETVADAPEAVTVGAAQLALELERREAGNLAEAAELMGYSADRLRVADAGPRLRQRQEDVISLLDKMIEESEQREAQGRAGAAPSGRPSSGDPQGKGGARAAQPRVGKDKSDAPEGAGRIGQLGRAVAPDASQVWGKLPPAERERILQTLKDRYPSRYRQLVEQYYRALAEQE